MLQQLFDDQQVLEWKDKSVWCLEFGVNPAGTELSFGMRIKVHHPLHLL
jgi:hypothetical protein